MVVLGIDPGVAPAMALYGGPETCPLVFPPMGVSHESKKVVAKKVKTVERTDPDEASILNIMGSYKPDVAAVELVGTMPGQGISSAGRFMYSAGLVAGMALGKGCRLIKVRPQEWRKALGMQIGKDISRQTCVRLFPWMAPKFALVKNHNEADALLIAVYVYCREMGLPVPRC